MNTLQLIKARALKTQAIDRARLLMTKAFGNPEHIDAAHTALRAQSTSQRRYRGVAYEPTHQQQQAKGGRDLLYRGITYGVY